MLLPGACVYTLKSVKRLLRLHVCMQAGRDAGRQLRLLYTNNSSCDGTAAAGPSLSVLVAQLLPVFFCCPAACLLSLSHPQQAHSTAVLSLRCCGHAGALLELLGVEALLILGKLVLDRVINHVVLVAGLQADKKGSSHKRSVAWGLQVSAQATTAAGLVCPLKKDEHLTLCCWPDMTAA